MFRRLSPRWGWWPLAAGVALMVLGVASWWTGRSGGRDGGPWQMQCGHYALQRVCQMLGVSVSERRLVELLRPSRRGHSFADMQKALAQLGLDAQGFREDWPALLAGPLPCIVQLRDPEHFVVLVRTQRDRVVLFDDLGQRRVAPAAAIRNRWTGAVLRVRRSSGAAELMPGGDGPKAVFDTLLVDAGELRGDEQQVTFRFPVANRGKAPLQIVAVEVGCSCLSVTRPDVIPPGKKEAIVLHYDPAVVRPAGTSALEAQVVTNDLALPKVRLTGLVSLPAAVQVVPPVVDLGRVPVDADPARGHVAVLYAGDDPGELRLRLVGELPRGVTWRSVTYEEFVRAVGGKGVFAEPGAPDRRHYFEITLDPAAVEASEGFVDGTLRFATGLAHAAEIRVPYRATLVQPVEARPRVLIFRPDEAGQATAAVQLHSRSRYEVRGVEPALPFSVRPVARPPDRPGYVTELRVSLPPEQARSWQGQPLRVRLAGPRAGRELILPLDMLSEATE